MDLLMRRRALMGGRRDSLDTDGLIGYWDSEDALIGKNWVDRVHSMNLILSGTAGKINDGIQLNNLPKPFNAYARLSTTAVDYLNQQINTEFTCFVDCLVKFNEASKNASIVDFGASGVAASNISALARINQNGSIGVGAKVGANSRGFYEQQLSVSGAEPITLGEYADMHIKLGVRVIDGEQEVYLEALGLRAYGISNSVRTINMKGNSDYPNCAFVLGIGYSSGDASANLWYPSYLSDVIYKKILLYNKAK